MNRSLPSNSEGARDGRLSTLRWLKRAWPVLAVGLLGLVVCLAEMRGKTPNPWADEVEYLNIGRAIAETGHYASSADHPLVDTGPSREPLYPLLVAAVMRVDPVLRDSAKRCIGNNQDPSCPAIYRSLRWTNALLCGVAAALALLAARRLHVTRAQAWVAGLYMALNFTMLKQASYIISDYLALALAGALVLALACAMERRRSFARWLVVGAVIGLLVLTKAIFEIYATLAVLVLAGLWIARRKPETLRALSAVCLALALLVGGWVARNWVAYGTPILNDARGGSALSQREELNHMTAGEYAASFFWWTRGPGASLARQIFPEKDWHRHEWYVPDGFFIVGDIVNPQPRIDRLMAERGLDQAAAAAEANHVVVREVIGEWPMHLTATIPIFYRGLWFDEFIVLGFPAFAWLLVSRARRGDWAWLAAMSPAMFSLIFYAILSINLTRYQFSAAAGIALSAGIAVTEIWARLRARIRPARQ